MQKGPQSAPKVTPKGAKGAQSAPKVTPKRNVGVVPVHQQMSASRYQARRTARSAYNIPKYVGDVFPYMFLNLWSQQKKSLA